MKRIVLIALILSSLLLLTACYEERGYAYKHLNDYEPGVIHSSYSDNDSELLDPTSDGIGGTYDHLNKLGCETRPHCCGEFTAEEIWYKDLENRAKVENNEGLCYSLPQEDLVVDCPGEDSYVYYSRSRCIVQFEGQEEQ